MYDGILFFLFLLSGIWDMHEKKAPDSPEKNISFDTLQPGDQIGRYIVSMLEDSRGNLWFGTLNKGMAKYDGKSLQYFTMDHGFPSNAVVSIVEDKAGILWFGTHNGLSKYDGQLFVNYSVKEGLCDFRVSDLFIDSQGLFWVGTWGGLAQFDGNRCRKFPLPDPEVDVVPNPDTEHWITSIFEDSKGNIWISREGYGAYQYDGSIFRSFTKADGLTSNNIHAIEEYSEGSIWFGTRVAEKDNADPEKRMGEGGLNQFNGTAIIGFAEIEGFHHDDVYDVYADSNGHLWVTTLSKGVYKYDGVVFNNISFTGEEGNVAVSRIMEDKAGNIWLGCAGGLYRVYENQIVNVTVNGPWT